MFRVGTVQFESRGHQFLQYGLEVLVLHLIVDGSVKFESTGNLFGVGTVHL